MIVPPDDYWPRIRTICDRALGIVESGQQHAAFISVAGALGVFQKEDVGRAGDDQPAIPGQHAVRKSEAIGEDRGLVILPVMMRRFEHDDAPLRRLGRVRIAAILRDEDAALFVERHGTR